MKFTATREQLLAPLSAVLGAIASKPHMPTLANVLLRSDAGKLTLTATDSEVQLVARSQIDASIGDVTVPAKKFADITKALPSGAELRFEDLGEGKATLKSGRSRFTLGTLAAADFPVMPEVTGRSVTLPKPTLAKVIAKTEFAMASMDVRYYLNGLMMQTDGEALRAVGTDGHRLALYESGEVADEEEKIIVPRKGVAELLKLAGGDGEIAVSFSTVALSAKSGDVALCSKLIVGKYPEYQRVMPKESPIRVVAGKAELLSSLKRVALMANDRYRGIKLDVNAGKLVITSSNPQQDEAEERIEVEHDGPNLQLGLSVDYLMDAVSAVDASDVEMVFGDASTACLIKDGAGRFVVMPMRI